MATSTIYNSETGYVWEGEQTGAVAIQNIYFRYATTRDEICAVAFGLDDDGQATRSTTLISGGQLNYDASTGYWQCLCPFDSCTTWKLFIWLKNTDLSAGDLEWTDGETIPVSSMITELNLLRTRVKEHTTNVARAISVPEWGKTGELYTPPVESRAGKFLGFDADGNPACGTDVEDYNTFYSMRETCEDLVKQAQEAAQDSATSATESAEYRDTAKEYADDAAEYADKANDYALTAQAYVQKVADAGATAINNITIAANTATEEIENLTTNAVNTATTAAENAEAYAEAAAESESNASDSYIQCVELVKSLSGAMRIEVVDALPSTGESSVFYFVGNDTDGYTEYVYTESQGWISMGSTDYSALKPATVNSYGLVRLGTSTTMTSDNSGVVGLTSGGQLMARSASLTGFGTVKLSTSTTLTEGGTIGLNSSGQMLMPAATLSTWGAVKLGSQYYSTYSQPYVVGIGLSNTESKYGQLAFNLRQTQSDGSAGCLRYENISTDDSTKLYEMYVTEAGYDQMGIVKLLSSLNGYEDEEIEACRETHAASVGLVLDGLDSFCEGFFTDERIYEYFEKWATEGDMVEELWTNYGTNIVSQVADVLEADETFLSTVKSYTESVSTSWLTETITDEYVYNLFLSMVNEQVDALVEDRWTNELDKHIADEVEAEVASVLSSSIRSYFENSENVQTVSEIILNTLSDDVLDNAEEAASSTALSYIKGVFAGTNSITVNGSATTFQEWCASEIQSLLTAQITGLQSQITALTTAFNNRFTTISSKATLWKYEEAGKYLQDSAAEIDISNYDALGFRTITVEGITMPATVVEIKHLRALWACESSATFVIPIEQRKDSSYSSNKKYYDAAENVKITRVSDSKVKISTFGAHGDSYKVCYIYGIKYARA